MYFFDYIKRWLKSAHSAEHKNYVPSSPNNSLHLVKQTLRLSFEQTGNRSTVYYVASACLLLSPIFVFFALLNMQELTMFAMPLFGAALAVFLLGISLAIWPFLIYFSVIFLLLAQQEIIYLTSKQTKEKYTLKKIALMFGTIFYYMLVMAMVYIFLALIFYNHIFPNPMTTMTRFILSFCYAIAFFIPFLALSQTLIVKLVDHKSIIESITASFERVANNFLYLLKASLFLILLILAFFIPVVILTAILTIILNVSTNLTILIFILLCVGVLSITKVLFFNLFILFYFSTSKKDIPQKVDNA